MGFWFLQQRRSMSFSKWWLSLHPSLYAEEKERKLVKICPFDISDSTDVNVTNIAQLEIIYSFE